MIARLVIWQRITSSPVKVATTNAGRRFAAQVREGEWNSDDYGGFPLAIEVTLQMDPFRATNPSLANDEDEMDYYRTVIHLPVAEPPPEEAE